jgi:integrase/recombinase XerD
MAMDKMIRDYRKDCQLRGFAPKTINNYSYFINLYRKFLSEQKKDIRKGDREDLKSYLAYLQNKGYKSATIEHSFKSIHSFYDFLIESKKIEFNPVDHVRKRYLKKYKSQNQSSSRQCISIEDASRLINSILDTRDRAILLLLFKTGARLHEILDLDISDIDLKNYQITLKPTPKRSNRIVFFDVETADQLQEWLPVREKRSKGNPALWIGPAGKRLQSDPLRRRIEKYAARMGLHDPNSERMENRFTPHCARHWFSTHLIRSGMPREYIKELRGDARRDAIDIYNHIDQKALKESYLGHIPSLGI